MVHSHPLQPFYEIHVHFAGSFKFDTSLSFSDLGNRKMPSPQTLKAVGLTVATVALAIFACATIIVGTSSEVLLIIVQNGLMFLRG